jgi:hypothetical protein
MKFSICLLGSVLSTLAFQSNATPWGLPGEAVIRSSDGKLAICLPEKALDDVGVSSISVSERSPGNKARQTVWKIELNKGGSPTVLNPGGCIYYGAKLIGYRQRVTAKPVKAANVYYARMNMIVASPSRQSILFYDAVFCVSGQRDGSLIFSQYRYEEDGSVIKPPC